MDFYNQTLKEVHYNPFLFIEETSCFSEVEILKQGLTDSLKVEDLMISLYRLSGILEERGSRWWPIYSH
jgi:hypothetical protein